MISERTLRKWRRDALKDRDLRLLPSDSKVAIDFISVRCLELSDRILRLTQELLDQHLLRK